MSIVILGDEFSFPEGDAPTNRVHSFSKGIFENGINVHVVCFQNDYLDNYDGITGGVKYYHPFGQTKRSEYFVIRRWQKLMKYFKTIQLLKRINSEDRVTAIIIYTMLFSTYLLAWYLSRIHRTKLVIESSEHPLRHYKKNALKKVEGIIKLYFESRLCDGIFCISRYIVDFYLDRGLPRKNLLLLPSTVDPSRFFENGEKPLPFPYIAYFGSLTFKRDNIDNLIRAFAIVSNKHPEFHLVLGGFCSDKEKKQIEDLILELNISLKVMLLKYLPREEIIRYVKHSDILVSVRGKDLASQASFPSKVIEYLAASKPLITVDVGEISDYLVDGVNCYLVEPENSDKLSEKIEYIINNYELALEVAKRGKQLADTTFNYNYQAKRMIGFINTLYT